MGGGVILAGLVVPVAARIPWRDGVLQPMQDVVPEPRLVIVHEDRGTDVHRAYQDEAFLDSAGSDLRHHLVGDVDDLLAALGLEPEVMSVRCHTNDVKSEK